MDAVIWTEGISDQKFLADAIGKWFGVKFERSTGKMKGKDVHIFNGKNEFLSIDIQSLEGKNTILNEKQAFQTLKTPFSFNRDNGVLNIVILDADDKVSERIEEVEQSRKTLDENFPFFLFPDNKNIGDLETILQNIINPDNQVIFNCWNDYTACLAKIPHPQNPKAFLTLPDDKAKIYAYLALVCDSNSEKKKIEIGLRDYTNSNHWNLDHPYLNPLKTFLIQHLQISEQA